MNTGHQTTENQGRSLLGRQWREREAEWLTSALAYYRESEGDLPGLRPAGATEAFIDNLIQSRRRWLYPVRLAAREPTWRFVDPSWENFDPLRAAIAFHRGGQFDEALWLIFLQTHFGKHRRTGWQYLRLVYGRLGQPPGPWTWEAVSTDVDGFRQWLASAVYEIRSRGGGFGNHRKYESLHGLTPEGTGAVVESYLAWVGTGGHASRFSLAIGESRLPPEDAFEQLYAEMANVHRFGRVARFDYLSMVGKLGILDVRPGHPYLHESTGPLKGAKLLFDGDCRSSLPVSDLTSGTIRLNDYLQVGFDPLEDALCNWQKSPTSFVPFKG